MKMIKKTNSRRLVDAAFAVLFLGLSALMYHENKAFGILCMSMATLFTAINIIGHSVVDFDEANNA